MNSFNYFSSWDTRKSSREGKEDVTVLRNYKANSCFIITAIQIHSKINKWCKNSLILVIPDESKYSPNNISITQQDISKNLFVFSTSRLSSLNKVYIEKNIFIYKCVALYVSTCIL